VRLRPVTADGLEASSLPASPKDAKKFYALMAAFTALAVGMNCIGFNEGARPIQASCRDGIAPPPRNTSD